jgi:hypothetical protein
MLSPYCLAPAAPHVALRYLTQMPRAISVRHTQTLLARRPPEFLRLRRFRRRRQPVHTPLRPLFPALRPAQCPFPPHTGRWRIQPRAPLAECLARRTSLFGRHALTASPDSLLEDQAGQRRLRAFCFGDVRSGCAQFVGRQRGWGVRTVRRPWRQSVDFGGEG